jgi:hypothetical protein
VIPFLNQGYEDNHYPGENESFALDNIEAVNVHIFRHICVDLLIFYMIVFALPPKMAILCGLFKNN